MLEVKETAREGEEKQYNFNLNVVFYWVGAALSLSLLTGAIGWSYQLIVRDINQIPIVRAQLGPLRVAPDDPGGLTAANQGLSVTQLAVNERPLLSDEIFLAPAAEVLSEENVALSNKFFQCSGICESMFFLFIFVINFIHRNCG